MRAVDIAYIIWPISDGWSYISAVCAHAHAHTYTHTHTHTHTDYIDRSFFLFSLSLAQICTHGTNPGEIIQSSSTSDNNETYGPGAAGSDSEVDFDCVSGEITDVD
jgi:hypothetical protein